jgi:hypothetical protein
MWQRKSIGPSTVHWGTPESTVVSFDFSPSTIVRIDLAVRKFVNHLWSFPFIEQLEIWVKDWGMRFNATKCYLLSINKKSNTFYSLDNHITWIL